MTLPINEPNGEMVAYCKTASVGATPVAAWTIAPCKGRIVRTYAVLEGTITTAPAAIAVAINGAAAIGALSVATGAAGTGATDNPQGTTAMSLCMVNEGDFISFTPSGASGANIACTFAAVIRKQG